MANEKPQPKGIKKPTDAKLKKKLDALVSIYVRHTHAKNGNCTCYTCGVVKPIKQMHCGHYQPRNVLATRFDLRNLRPQCPGCNLWGNGKIDIFALNLEQELGHGILQELAREKQKTIRYYPYAEEIERYTELLKEMGVYKLS